MATRTITASGDLFTIAERELGDATQAVRIAALNGLADFMLSGLTTLLIPVPDASLTGGVPVGSMQGGTGAFFSAAAWDISTYDSGVLWV